MGPFPGAEAPLSALGKRASNNDMHSNKVQRPEDRERDWGERGKGGGMKRGHKTYRYVEINDMIFGKG